MKINALLVLVAALASVSASAYDDGRYLPGGCGDTFQGCWSDASGNACIPRVPAAHSTTQHRYKKQSTLGILESPSGVRQPVMAVALTVMADGRWRSGLRVPTTNRQRCPRGWQKRVAKELCRVTGANSVTFQVTAGFASMSIASSASYNCSRWFRVD